jgi:hypothetical protein
MGRRNGSSGRGRPVSRLGKEAPSSSSAAGRAGVVACACAFWLTACASAESSRSSAGVPAPVAPASPSPVPASPSPVPASTDLTGFRFPHWSRALPPAPPGLHVTIGPDDLRVEGAIVAPLPPKELRTGGFDASYKKGPTRLAVIPLAAALDAPHPADAVLAVDPETPYRILSEVLFTLGQAHVSGFHFLATYDTHSALGFALGSIDVNPPMRGSQGFPMTYPSAPIEVRLQPQSIVLMANGRSAPGGCGETASVAGQYDFAALTRCGGALKAADGLTGDLILFAKPTVPFRVIVSTMDALAQDYPHVMLGVMP